MFTPIKIYYPVIISRLRVSAVVALLAIFPSFAFAGDVPIPYDTGGTDVFAQCFSYDVYTDPSSGDFSVHAGAGSLHYAEPEFGSDIGDVYFNGADYRQVGGTGIGVQALNGTDYFKWTGAKDWNGVTWPNSGTIISWNLDLKSYIYYSDFTPASSTIKGATIHRGDSDQGFPNETYSPLIEPVMLSCVYTTNSQLDASGANPLSLTASAVGHAYGDISTGLESTVPATYEGCYSINKSTLVATPVSGNCGATAGTGTPPDPQVQDDDGDGFPNAEDPSPTDPCDPNPDSSACLTDSGQLIGFESLTLDQVLAGLNPLFSLYSAATLPESYSDSDSFDTNTELGYSLEFFDPNGYVTDVAYVTYPSCISSSPTDLFYWEREQLILDIDNETVRSSGNVGSLPWFNHNPRADASLPTICDYPTSLRFTLYDGRSILTQLETFSVTAISQVYVGVFDYDIDIPLPDDLPALFRALIDGFQVPFTSFSIGLEPVLNVVWDLIGWLFEFLFDLVPFFGDIPDWIAPPAGQTLTFPATIAGIPTNTYMSNQVQVSYAYADGSATSQLMLLLLKVASAIWALGFFFSSFFTSRR